MPVLNPAFAETISPQRPVEDFGDESFTDLPAVPAVITSGNTKMFVPRGSDLQANDRFDYQGRSFRVMGWPLGDRDHAFTGDNFGWVGFAIKADT